MKSTVGQTASRSLTLTAEHVAKYAEMTGEAEVVSAHPTKPVTQLKVRITRQTGETVVEGEAWCYTMSPQK